MKRWITLKDFLLVAGLVFFVALVCRPENTVNAQDPLASAERRGKQIYVLGTSASGKDIFAYVGEGSIEVPASTMACASCHGLDGQGKPEGGVSPSNLSWEALTKPYGLAHPDGRRHPAYTERGVELAVTRGTDPGGNRLQNVMPRYQMSKEDLADLIAYIKLLGKDRDPGISETKIVIGGMIPATGGLTEMGQAVKAVTTAYFDDLNSQGGIYNRKVELKFVETADTPVGTRANLERMLKEDQIFAMTGAFMAGSEKEVSSLLAQYEVPSVGPFTLFPQIEYPLNRQVFYLLSGIDGQTRVLANFVAGKPEFKNSSLMVVYPRSDFNRNMLESIKDQSIKAGLKPPTVYEYAPGSFDALAVVKQLNQSDPGKPLFFLGNTEDLLSLLQRAAEANWFPTVVAAGAGVGSQILSAPAGFDHKVFIAFPTSPADQSAEGMKEFRALAEKHKLPSTHLAAQISAFTAAKILTEALKRVGKDASREKLIQTLEGLYEYQTGLTPAITFGPNRRIGAMGSYVVTIDLKQKQFVPASGWINVGK
ncbi:MAG TPA: ABC transporter substrate-binding protein [Pyrinomonadaceae bacterium]|jgi:ABC-type branched-subunit amino acid transport system substrate-binding protein|nr:ABC transporter substrate-binding protein [Pyrinomonadaceae bacterium]